MPVAANRPRTLPSGEMPDFSNTKRSCSVITSPSMFPTSVIESMRREPSLNRAVCTTRSTAEEICCRMDVKLRFEFAIVTMTSRREITSRGVLA